jgi:uncharacterized spore protein YtfJ
MNLRRDPGVLFTGVFNLGKSRNTEIKEIINDIPIPETDTKVGKPIELTGRTIYPVIKTYLTTSQNFAVIEIFPVALVIQEQDNEYVMSLTEDEINRAEFIKMVHSKKGMKDK